MLYDRDKLSIRWDMLSTTRSDQHTRMGEIGNVLPQERLYAPTALFHAPVTMGHQ